MFDIKINGFFLKVCLDNKQPRENKDLEIFKEKMPFFIKKNSSTFYSLPFSFFYPTCN